MNNYLNTNKFKAAEAHHLRLAFEEVTGRDLNWYFNQWYFSSGNPEVTIDYDYNDAAGTVNVIVKQIQKTGKLFTLPLAIDVYNGTNKVRHRVWAKNAVDTFTFNYTKRPELVNVDGDKIMLWAKEDNKTLENYIHQFKYAGLYVDRFEAVQFAGKNQNNPKAVELLKSALKDKYHGLRNYAINILDFKNESVKKEVEAVLVDLAKNDKKSIVRGNAIGRLGDYKKADYIPLFRTATKDSSYTVAGNALEALGKSDEAAAMAMAKELAKQPSKGLLKEAITTVIASSGDESLAEEIIGGFAAMPLNQAKFQTLNSISAYLIALKNIEKIKWGIDEIVKFRDDIPEAFSAQTDPYINGVILRGIVTKKEEALKANPNDAALKELVDYIKAKIPVDKKGF